MHCEERKEGFVIAALGWDLGSDPHLATGSQHIVHLLIIELLGINLCKTGKWFPSFLVGCSIQMAISLGVRLPFWGEYTTTYTCYTRQPALNHSHNK